MGESTDRRFIDATFDIVTPMFLGGADQQASRIRETSLKGTLAFWWRALNFSSFVQQQEGDLKKALDQMREQELELFGGPGGQGAFLLRVDLSGSLEATRDNIGPELKGAIYLGYGCIGPTRSYLKGGSSFSVRVVFRPKATDAQCQEIASIIKAFGLFGGLGSRVRRGYGSVALTRFEPQGIDVDSSLAAIPVTEADYGNQIRNIVGAQASLGISGREFPITAFARETECRVLKRDDRDALQALDHIGREMLLYRSWGRGGEVLSEQSEKNFELDHDWYKQGRQRPLSGSFDGESVELLPRRAAFGLPHNYSGMSVEGPQPKTQERRASPLFIHIHKLVVGQVLGCLLYFPNKFLDMPRLRVNGETKDYKFDRSVISGFLARLDGNSSNPLSGTS